MIAHSILKTASSWEVSFLSSRTLYFEGVNVLVNAVLEWNIDPDSR